MKYFMIIALSLQGVWTSSYNKQQAFLLKPTAGIDTSRYSILKFDKDIDKYAFDKKVKPCELNGIEIQQIENLIGKKVSEYNKIEKDSSIAITKRLKRKMRNTNFIWKGDYIETPVNYYKQLIPVINSKGEKEVWVNCFCDKEEKAYWKKSIVLVTDGGSCYFNLKINLTKNLAYDLMVNGVA